MRYKEKVSAKGSLNYPEKNLYLVLFAFLIVSQPGGITFGFIV